MTNYVLPHINQKIEQPGTMSRYKIGSCSLSLWLVKQMNVCVIVHTNISFIMWMFCSEGISNSVSRGARPSLASRWMDHLRPARKLFTHWKILNKYFVFLPVAKLDLTLSKHSMLGVVSEEAQCVLCLIDGWSDGRVWR